MRARENLFSPLLFLWQALTSTVGNNGSGHTNNIILWFIHWGSRAKPTHTFLVCNTHAVPRGLLTPVVSPSVLLRLRHPVVTGAIFTVVLWVILADRQYTGSACKWRHIRKCPFRHVQLPSLFYFFKLYLSSSVGPGFSFSFFFLFL